MNGSTRSGNYVLILAICMLTLVPAVAWSAAAATAAEVQNRGSIPEVQEDDLPEVPPVGENDGALPTRQQPSPTPTTAGNGGTPTPTPDANLSVYKRFDPSAPNRIVFHAATPVQLCKEGDGLQVFFVGSDGTTRLGPWVPPFSELAELYPEGGTVSLFSGNNRLTGKSVNIDYLPSVHRIRVVTFYADTDYDINKPYIFHFGPEHDITYDAW